MRSPSLPHQPHDRSQRQLRSGFRNPTGDSGGLRGIILRQKFGARNSAAVSRRGFLQNHAAIFWSFVGHHRLGYPSDRRILPAFFDSLTDATLCGAALEK